MRRIVLLLAALAGLVLLAACGKPRGSVADPALLREGKEIYSFEGCGGCHGAQRQGSRAAPRLDKLGRHWTEQELLRYLANPAGYPQDGRLAALEERYPGSMAGLPGAGEERLRALTRFLLSR